MAIGGSDGPRKSFGPTQKDLDDTTLSDWVGVETDQESQTRDRNFPQDLKNAFGFRTVSSIPPEKIQKQLPEYEGRYPERQEKTGLARVRKISRFLSKTQKEQTILPHSVKSPSSEFQLSLTPDTPLEDTPVHVHVSDDELIASMKMTGKVFTRPDSRSIFSGEPSPVDVQQTDQRSTCYMMSMLAAYAASPIGKRILEAMVRTAGKDLALVTFYDPLIQENIQVMVSTSRLVDKSGKDIYSFGNPTEARWAGVIEKAYHAYKLSRSKRMKEEIEKAKQNGEADRAAHYIDQLHKVAPLDPKRSVLDWGDVLQSVSCMPELPEMKDRPQESYTYQPNSPRKLNEYDFKTKKNIEELRYNIELGVPVILGTPGMTPKGIYRALSTGTPTAHAIAVIGPAQMIQGGKFFDGVMVYDQYGSSLDGGVEVNASTSVVTKTRAVEKPEMLASSETALLDEPAPEDTDTEKSGDPTYEPELVTDEVINPFLTKAAGRSVRFYSYDQLHKYFVKGSMARGCYN